MKDILKMRRNLKALSEELRELEEKDGERTPEELVEMNRIMTQMDEHLKQIKTAERGGSIHDELEKPQDESEEVRAVTTNAAIDRMDGRSRSISGSLGNYDFEQIGKYFQSIARAQSPVGGQIAGLPTGLVEPELRALQSEEAELRAITGLGGSIPADGGFLVSKDYRSEIERLIFENNFLWNSSRKFTITQGNGIRLPASDSTSRADGSRPTRGYWSDEGAGMTASAPKFRLISMDAEKLTALVYSTDELLEDATLLGQFIVSEAIAELDFKISDAIINGDGAAKPLGILNAACFIPITKETSQVAATVVYENVVKQWSRMLPRSRSRAVWLANADILPQMMTMSIAIGTGGSAVWQPAGGAANRPNDTLMGRPIHYVEACPTLGTVGDIILADMSQYVTIDKGGVQQAQSIHVAFLTNQTVFRFVMRLNGQPALASAISPFKGNSTIGPFLGIATRS